MSIVLHVWLSVLDKAEGLWEEKIHISLNQVHVIIYIKAITPSYCWENWGSKHQLIWFCQNHRTERQKFLDLKLWAFEFKVCAILNIVSFLLESRTASISDLTVTAFIWSFFFHSVNSIYILCASFGLCSQNTMGNNSGSRTYFQGVYISSKGEWRR